ncbi:MAG: LamG-like jellyroll fold domain-containing protein [Candidatus Eisenbacteria bacterium]
MKNGQQLILAVLCLSLCGPFAGAVSGGTLGGSGDTLLVRTFTFDDIETRRVTFDFPDDERTWERITMRYTLKCDEATVGDPHPCGEWDVTTHVTVHAHTGVTDSTLLTHPYFVVEGESPDELRYVTIPSFHHFTWWEDPDGAIPGDRYMRFDGTDCITVPSAAVASVDSSITIEFWCRGADSQPLNDHIVEAGNEGGRVVNIHLPWGTGAVYWDAGGRLAGANNRLSKDAAPSDYKGRWNHWAFTKDTRSGEMRIYLNGELWHEAGNMKKDIPPIDSFIIGANLYRNNEWYAGDLDDVRVWSAALDGEAIEGWRHGNVSSEHPFFEHLLVEYRFDENDPAGSRIVDSSPNGHHGMSFGQPQRIPFGLTGRADVKPGARALLRTESVHAPRLSVEIFEDEENPEELTRIEDVWPAFDSWFDGDGVLLREEPAKDALVLEQGAHQWYGAPFEVVEKYEVARFITPYGLGLDLGEDGFTWLCDVTDYAPLLRGEVDLQAGNTLELLDLTFEFVEGTPPREVLGIRNLWPLGDYGYRELADDEELAGVALALDPAAAGFRVRSRISGHGHAGPHNCCEWDAKEHSLAVDGQDRFHWTVWRDCGMNPVHPQGGTWQFDRAGWCPGTFVDTYEHELTRWVEPGAEVVLDYGIEPYDPENGEADGRFVVSHQLFSYGPPSFGLDAAAAEVIAPSAHGEYRRLNPVSGEAVVRIRNMGAAPLTGLTILYGLVDGRESSFAWEGELAFLESEVVTLPAPDWTGMGEGAGFFAEVAHPNGGPDENRSNDRAVATVAAPRVLPPEFLIEVETPGFGRAADNSYTITDRDGFVVARRDSFEDEATYRDRVELMAGSYTLEFLDTGEDGLIRHWWLRGSAPDSVGQNGALRLLDADGGLLLDLGYDFAEKRTLRFFVGDPR